MALWLGCQEIVLDKGQQDDWFASTLILSFAVVAALSFLAFIPWELSRRDPVVDVRLVFSRQFGTAFAVMVAVGAILFGTTQILPQMMQEVYGYTAYLAGLALMPGGLSMLVMMPLAGQVANHIQAKYLIAAGMFVIALAMWHMTGLNGNVTFGWLSWARIYQMVGLPFLFIPINTAAYAGLAPQKTNQASAQINMARNLGGSFGISIANTDTGPPRSVPPCPAGRPRLPVLARVPNYHLAGRALFHRPWRLAGTRQGSGYRLARRDHCPPGDVAGLYRRILGRGGIRPRPGATDSSAPAAGEEFWGAAANALIGNVFAPAAVLNAPRSRGNAGARLASCCVLASPRKAGTSEQ